MEDVTHVDEERLFVRHDEHVYVDICVLEMLLVNSIRLAQRGGARRVFTVHNLWQIHSQLCERAGVEVGVPEPPEDFLDGAPRLFRVIEV